MNAAPLLEQLTLSEKTQSFVIQVKKRNVNQVIIKMKTVLVTGASGLIGSALCKRLEAKGNEVRTLSRSGGGATWDIEAGTISDEAMDKVDGVIHLAGEPIAQRWSEETKQRIIDSREKSVRILVEGILKQPKPPIYISASGINFYGFNRKEPVDEHSESGEGFLAEVCRKWEGAAQPLTEAGVRTVFIRTGIVLSAEGGALAKMLTPFKLGVGGRIGSGTQLMSWISLPDLVELYCFALEKDELSGPVNAVSPNPVSNASFTKELGKVLNRPTIFPLPVAVIKALFGEMGQETVLADLTVLPTRAEEAGFIWKTPELKMALSHCLRD